MHCLLLIIGWFVLGYAAMVFEMKLRLISRSVYGEEEGDDTELHGYLLLFWPLAAMLFFAAGMDLFIRKTNRTINK